MMFRLFLLTALPVLLLGSQLSAGVFYTVKFPDDRTIIGCGAKADTVMPVIENYNYDDCSINVGVSVRDQIFYFSANRNCYRIVRRFRLIYWCTYKSGMTPYMVLNPTNTSVGATAQGNLYNNGYLQYEQIIDVRDGEPPRFLNCPAAPVVFCDLTSNDPTKFNNKHRDLCEGSISLRTAITDRCSGSAATISYRLYLDLDANGSMEALITGPAQDTGVWSVERTIVADTVRGRIRFPVGYALPYGTHKIEWIARDECGNQSYCKYDFIVKDCLRPTIFCDRGFSVNVMQNDSITLPYDIFVKYAFDNCTTPDALQYGISKAGTTKTFPDSSLNVTYTCSTLDSQLVDIWVRDLGGNASFCRSLVLIQDNTGNCGEEFPADGAGDRSADAEASGSVFQLQAVRPNPAHDQLQVSFDLPEAGEVTFALSDLAGRTLSTQRLWRDAGRHTQVLPLADLPIGLLLLRVETAVGSAVRKIVRQ